MCVCAVCVSVSPCARKSVCLHFNSHSLFSRRDFVWYNINTVLPNGQDFVTMGVSVEVRDTCLHEDRSHVLVAITQTHTRTHTLAHTLALAPSNNYTHFQTLRHTLSLTRTLAHSHAYTLTHTLSVPCHSTKITLCARGDYDVRLSLPTG